MLLYIIFVWGDCPPLHHVFLCRKISFSWIINPLTHTWGLRWQCIVFNLKWPCSWMCIFHISVSHVTRSLHYSYVVTMLYAVASIYSSYTVYFIFPKLPNDFCTNWLLFSFLLLIFSCVSSMYSSSPILHYNSVLIRSVYGRCQMRTTRMSNWGTACV